MFVAYEKYGSINYEIDDLDNLFLRVGFKTYKSETFRANVPRPKILVVNIIDVLLYYHDFSWKSFNDGFRFYGN